MKVSELASILNRVEFAHDKEILIEINTDHEIKDSKLRVYEENNKCILELTIKIG